MSAEVSVPAPGHIGLNVSRLDRSVDFYRAVFGFEVLQRSTDAARPFAFLGHDGAIVLTLWQQSDGALDAVREAETRLRGLGARLHHDGIVAHAEGADSGGLFFEDPDGIRLEIFAPRGLAGTPAACTDGPTCGFF